MKLANGGWRRQGALPVIMVGACAVLAACALSGGELTQPDDTATQTIHPTETTQTTLNPTGTTQTTADPTGTTLDSTGTTQTTIDAPTTTQTTAEPTETTETTGTTVDSTGTTQTTIGSAETGVTLAPPGVEPTRDYLAMREHITRKGTFPMMVAAPGGFVVADPGAENAVERQDARQMLELGALAIAYEFWGLMMDYHTPCPAHLLRVSWEWPEHVLGPEEDIRHGGYSPPLGPPRAGADRAAGIVYCKGTDYYYMGFDAIWKQESKAWAMYATPTG